MAISVHHDPNPYHNTFITTINMFFSIAHPSNFFINLWNNASSVNNTLVQSLRFQPRCCVVHWRRLSFSSSVRRGLTAGFLTLFPEADSLRYIVCGLTLNCFAVLDTFWNCSISWIRTISRSVLAVIRRCRHVLDPFCWKLYSVSFDQPIILVHDLSWCQMVFHQRAFSINPFIAVSNGKHELRQSFLILN